MARCGKCSDISRADPLLLRFLLVKRSENADFVILVLIEVEIVQMTIPTQI